MENHALDEAAKQVGRSLPSLLLARLHTDLEPQEHCRLRPPSVCWLVRAHYMEVGLLEAQWDIIFKLTFSKAH